MAHAKVDALLDSLHEGADPASVRRLVIQVASVFHLVTPYTSLVAIEEVKTAEGKARTARIANALPLGSRLGETLPQGGTSGPLLVLVGCILTAAGASLGLIARPLEVRTVLWPRRFLAAAAIALVTCEAREEPKLPGAASLPEDLTARRGASRGR